MSGNSNPYEYTVAWICVLEAEITAARVMLEEDEVYDPAPVHRAHGDENSYISGSK
ncbi:hypothetical protein UA08_06246 [Talaromyces atroroseus]|uniref:Uncharacterized protein n=1 Tax=Talaromyces atroroseus TaxID=1441469 RepID=A0A225AKC7_TALAT|nr:hypothetical protein UA08_06246 [Talaromyces atroroseus]OKL58754.1 hypothetical protein UA08_06246 [Talaromyces atroroseus]